MATRTNAVTVTAVLVTLVAIAARLPAGARASAIRVAAAADDDDDGARWPAAAVTASDSPAVVREKRTLLKLKPLIVLPAKLAVGAGAKLVAGAKLGVKAVELGSKALGVGAIGLKAVKKVAKVTVKAATALGIKAVLLNFLFQKVNQVIDFKTRLLGNLDQRNRQQNAQFLSPAQKTSSIGNKDEMAFVPETPAGYVASVDSPAFSTVATPQPPQAFNPGSDLIASPPPPNVTNGFASPPGFGASPPGFVSQPGLTSQPGFASQPGFGASQPMFGASQPMFGASPSFGATNDDGSPSSETSF